MEVFEAAKLFAKVEGLVPAPETAHAVKAAIDEAIKAKKNKRKKLYCLTSQVTVSSICKHIKNSLKES